MSRSRIRYDVTDEQVDAVNSMMRRIVEGSLTNSERTSLHRHGGLLLAMTAAWRSVADESHVYPVNVKGQRKEMVIISPCPGNAWVFASEFLLSMKLAGRMADMETIRAFTGTYAHLGLEHKLFAGGEVQNERDYCEVSQICGRDILTVPKKSMMEYYRYLALKN